MHEVNREKDRATMTTFCKMLAGGLLMTAGLICLALLVGEVLT